MNNSTDQGKCKKVRNANIELLRIISMCMIVFLHALGKGNLLVNVAENPSINGTLAWLIESFSIAAVNIFVLISGYFLIDSTFKISRVIDLCATTVFYSLGAFLLCLLLGIDTGEKINTYFLLHTIFPIHMDLYWFVTAYLVVYMLLPILSSGVKNITQKELRNTIIILLVFESAFKSFLPFRFNEDGYGYNVIWFIIVFVIGAYVKLYGFTFLTSKVRGIAVYIACSILIFSENILIDYVVAKTGHLSEILEVSMEYNHILVLVAAVGIFSAFINSVPIDGKAGRIICFLSPMSLGVYLLHENLSIRYNWQKWLGIYDSLNYPTFIFVGRLVLSVLCIYALGTIIDYIRIRLFELLCLGGKKIGKNRSV